MKLHFHHYNMIIIMQKKLHRGGYMHAHYADTLDVDRFVAQT